MFRLVDLQAFTKVKENPPRCGATLSNECSLTASCRCNMHTVDRRQPASELCAREQRPRPVQLLGPPTVHLSGQRGRVSDLFLLTRPLRLPPPLPIPPSFLVRRRQGTMQGRVVCSSTHQLGLRQRYCLGDVRRHDNSNATLRISPRTMVISANMIFNVNFHGQSCGSIAIDFDDESSQ